MQRKIWTSKQPMATASATVGQTGDIWYDEADGILRLGNGTTQGGIPLTGGTGEGASLTLVMSEVAMTLASSQSYTDSVTSQLSSNLAVQTALVNGVISSVSTANAAQLAYINSVSDSLTAIIANSSGALSASLSTIQANVLAVQSAISSVSTLSDEVAQLRPSSDFTSADNSAAIVLF